MRALALLGALSCLAGPLAAAGAEAPAEVDAALPDAPPLPPEVRAALVEALAARSPDAEPRTRHRRPDGSPRYTNRLLLESSPYLRQHAHNPVDWRPWGDDAFAEARRLKRPVLVSIGYSTCHWCHVMEEESFDDLEIARLLNANFIAIKVDREMRPDVDAVYMAAIQAMGRSGGWPLNVFVTPERKPFYAGTYFPPRDRAGRPGLERVLSRIAAEYADSPERIDQLAGRVESAVQRALETAVPAATSVPGPEVLEAAAHQALARVDWTWGGAGPAPKFPSGLPLRLLLRYHRRSGDPEALRAVELTLEKMAAGGIRDHVGGGFHRYATDERWRVPHFEKMLYDNALLATLYLEAWQATGRQDFARVSREILDSLEREMAGPEGGFISAMDADSRAPDGGLEEGRYYTWTPAELEQALGPEAARVAAAWYDVTPEGELEGRNVLHTPRSAGEVAAALGLEPAAFEAERARIRETLRAGREARPAPLRDEKVVAAWNGLAIAAFARAGLAFAEPAYVATAARSADFVLTRMRRDGRLQRAFVDGQALGPAFLEDYAFLIDGLIQLYEADADPRWLREAVALQAVLDAHYADPAGGAYSQTAHDGEALLAREKPLHDAALPSGNSVAALNLLRLADFSFDESYRQRALGIFSAFRADVVAAPAGFGELTLALDYLHDTAKEIVLVRPPGGGDLDAMLDPLRRSFVPNRVLAVVTQGGDLESQAAVAPLVAGKRARQGQVTAYVCENRVCALPTGEPDVFARQLARVKPLE